MAGVDVGPLREQDLAEADRIVRVAFGTHLRSPDPEHFMGDAGYVRTRWRAAPGNAFRAELDGQLAGSQFLTRWGSVAFFGPLTVRPELWGKGVAQALMQATMARFAEWDVPFTGLFTFAESAKHVHLYQKFGFFPRYLTAIVAQQVRGGPAPVTLRDRAARDVPDALRACAELTGRVFPGLEVGVDIRAVHEQKLGETVLLEHDGRIEGLAVCHAGAGTEAGSNTCYIKFAAVAPGAGAAQRLDQLLDACDAYAQRAGAQHLLMGVNAGRRAAWERVMARDVRVAQQGVIMEHGEGYNEPGTLLIDDWR